MIMSEAWTKRFLLGASFLALVPCVCAETQVPYDPARPDGEWYYRPDAFKEPKITEIDEKTPTIRFFWIRTFHRPVSIRVFRDAKGPKLRVVRCSGGGGYDWKQIEWDKTISLEESEWKQVLEAFENADVQAPLRKLKNDEKNLLRGLDGSRWVIESKINGKLTYAMVWSPGGFLEDEQKSKAGLPKELNLRPFFDFGLMLLDLSGILEPIY